MRAAGEMTDEEFARRGYVRFSSDGPWFSPLDVELADRAAESRARSEFYRWHPRRKSRTW